MVALSLSIRDWFRKKETTRRVMATLGRLNHFLFGLEGLTQAQFHRPPETGTKQHPPNADPNPHDPRDVVHSVGLRHRRHDDVLAPHRLVFSKIEPFVESLFFVSVITFLMRFLAFLIKDLRQSVLDTTMVARWRTYR